MWKEFVDYLRINIFGLSGAMNMEKYILIPVKPIEGELEEVEIKLTFLINL